MQLFGKGQVTLRAGSVGRNEELTERCAGTGERFACTSHRATKRLEIPFERPKLEKPKDAQHYGSGWTSFDRRLMPDEQRVWIEEDDVVVRIENQDGSVGAGQDHRTRRLAGFACRFPLESRYRGRWIPTAQIPRAGPRGILGYSPSTFPRFRLRGLRPRSSPADHPTIARNMRARVDVAVSLVFGTAA